MIRKDSFMDWQRKAWWSMGLVGMCFVAAYTAFIEGNGWLAAAMLGVYLAAMALSWQGPKRIL